MNKFSAKNKIILACVIWVAISALMFMFLFKILDTSNQAIIDSYAVQEQKLNVLLAEQQSYLKANEDLNTVSQERYQPDDLFSKDVSLVNELATLENLSQNFNVKMTISGLSGTINTAKKAATKSEIYQIPYSLTLSGTLNDCEAFLESLENLKFVTTTSSLTVTTASDGKVLINLNAFFYLKKQ